MQILGCQCEDLVDSYRQYGTDIADSQSKAMLDLLELLKLHESDYVVYALTSHRKLCLLSEDHYDATWWVTVSPEPLGSYRVEYLMESSIAPWPGAYITGEARELDQAIQMVLVAIKRSGGWDANRE